MILFKGCEVYAPERMGSKDVLVAGTKVVAIADEIPEPAGLEVEVVSAGGLRLIPGLIDSLKSIQGAVADALTSREKSGLLVDLQA